jgi:predicted nucleotidyltransferase
MSPTVQALTERTVQALRERLATNLSSCCLYGSAVRGNFIEGVSDINLLIVLNESNPAAHEAVAGAIGSDKQIDPFILGKPGFERSVRAFAAKFASIKRNYRVLYGEDPLTKVTIEPKIEKFLCEQALRNLRLRMVYAYVTRDRNKTYERFLFRSITPLFIQFSEVLRLEGISIPNEFPARIALFEKHFGIDGNGLKELLELRTTGSQSLRGKAAEWHQSVFAMVDAVVKWVEAKWSEP